MKQIHNNYHYSRYDFDLHISNENLSKNTCWVKDSQIQNGAQKRNDRINAKGPNTYKSSSSAARSFLHRNISEL